MTTAKAKSYPDIVRDKKIVGGEPIVKGTRVPVRPIVIHHALYGSLARVTEAFPRVMRHQAEQALVYYEAHRQEIDRHIAENESNERRGPASGSTWMSVLIAASFHSFAHETSKGRPLQRAHSAVRPTRRSYVVRPPTVLPL